MLSWDASPHPRQSWVSLLGPDLLGKGALLEERKGSHPCLHTGKGVIGLGREREGVAPGTLLGCWQGRSSRTQA